MTTTPLGASGRTPMSWVARAQRGLSLVAWTRASSFGAIAAVASWLLMSAAANSVASAKFQWAVIGVSGAVGGVVTWLVRRRIGVLSSVRAALWLEEQQPTLRFALVTLAEYEPGRGSSARDPLSADARARLVASVGAVDVSGPLQEHAWRRLRVPVVLALVVAMSAVPLHAVMGRITAPIRERVTGVRSSDAPVASRGQPLANWRVRVVPPAYANESARELGDANSVMSLTGSRIEVIGADRELPTIVLQSLSDSTTGSREISREQSGTGWRTSFAMPFAPAQVRVSLGAANRLLLLEPRPDSLPVVRLLLPERDTVLRTVRGNLVLDAEAHDDLGLAWTAFELIVSSGEGERFTARAAVVNARRLSRDANTAWRATLLLDTMRLEPGDLVHMRAVARDFHPDTSRGQGASETRTVRVARRAEYDSVAVDPAPPPAVDKSLLSQRMLLILTEKLEQRRPRLSRTSLVAESRSLAADQARLRKAVGELVFQRLEGESSAEHSHFPGDGHEHGVELIGGKLVPSTTNAGSMVLDFEGDESPIVAINRPLLEAYNAMWDAASALDVAEPKAAIPHMRAALAAIQRARSAERIYLRGKPPVVVIDVAKVRLAGKDQGLSNVRAVRDALAPRNAAWDVRLLSAATLLQRDASAGRDSLAVLRLEALTDGPQFATALGDALELLRRGSDVTVALVRARRALTSSVVVDSLSPWRGNP